MPTLAEVQRYAEALASLDDMEDVFDQKHYLYDTSARKGYREHYYRKADHLLRILKAEPNEEPQ